MFTIWGPKRTACGDGVSRREFLRFGALGVGGLDLNGRPVYLLDDRRTVSELLG